MPLALAASAAVHLAVSSPLRHGLETLLTPGTAPPVRMVELSDRAWDANRAVRDPARKAAPRDPTRPASSSPAASTAPAASPAPSPTPSPEPPKPTAGQIVETPPSPDDQAPDDARFLSKYAARVEKQTVARMDQRDPNLTRVTNKLQRTGEERNDPEAIKTPNLSVEGQGGTESRDKREVSRHFELKVPDILKREALQLRDPRLLDGPGLRERRGSEALRGNADRLEMKPGTPGQEDTDAQEEVRPGTPGGRGEQNVPSLQALMPNLGTVARVSGSPSNDYVDDVPEGEGTFLNAREFKYATFFYGVKHAVAPHWSGPALDEYRRRDPTGAVFGTQDRATLLRVVLSSTGELDTISVERGSGLDFLDRVAVEAFRQAQPFPNPPVGIRDEDGRIRFNFTFVVSNGSGGFNFFR